MLIAMYSNEQDPVRRDKFFNMLKMKYCGMSDDMIKIELMKLKSLKKSLSHVTERLFMESLVGR